MYSRSYGSGSQYAKVAERWVEYNTLNAGRSSKKTTRVRFHDRCYQSYSTVVATFHKTGDGADYALLSDFRYSQSTDNHIGYAASALRKAGVPYFSVPSVGGYWDTGRMAMHNDNASQLHTNLQVAIEKAVKAWKRLGDKDDHWTIQYSDDRVRGQHEIYLHYLATTGATGPAVDDIVTIMDRIVAQRAAKYDEYYAPKKVAARERARARTLAKRAMGL